MKIRKVEIQAFKSYLEKKDGTFEFTLPTSGEIANFSSIYAPNGFGKTSFFDAVDYAITGKIERFSRDSTLRNIHKSEARSINETGKRQYLLRNKTIGAQDTDVQVAPLTEVTVHTSNRIQPFKSDYNFPQRRSLDYNFPSDCKPRTKFFERVLLSQESIDAFLRETTPEGRYNKFIESVGDLTGEDNKRRSLEAIKNELEHHREDLRKETEKCEAELAAVKTRDNPIDKANQLVTEINSIAEDPISPFDAQHNEMLHEELLTQLVALEEQSSDSMREFDKKKVNAERQLNSLLETQRKVENLTQLKATETYIDQAIQDAENKKQLELNKTTVQAEIDQISGQLQSIQGFLNQTPEFIEFKSSSRQLEKEQNRLVETMNSSINKKNVAEAELKLIRVSLGKAKEELDRLHTESKIGKERFEKLSKLKTERECLEGQLAAYQSHPQQERIHAIKCQLLCPVRDNYLVRFFAPYIN
ncbi:MAG: exonuclease SbcC [Desulforhopalus sp.]|jgi:exonuclease SbcC